MKADPIFIAIGFALFSLILAVGLWPLTPFATKEQRESLRRSDEEWARSNNSFESFVHWLQTGQRLPKG